ncbi:MAG: hypothetical protein AB8B75_13050 [Roseobacter sp.]
MAAALLTMASVPASAMANEELVASLNMRIDEISVQISDLQTLIDAGGPARQLAVFRSQQQSLNVRRGQLVALLRVIPSVPVENEQLQEDIVTFQDEDVSPT